MLIVVSLSWWLAIHSHFHLLDYEIGFWGSINLGLPGNYLDGSVVVSSIGCWPGCILGVLMGVVLESPSSVS